MDYVEHVFDRPSGTQQKVTIHAPSRIGLPTPIEEDVVIAWDYRLNNWPLLLPGAAAARIAISADGKKIVTGGYDAKFQLWDAATGKRLVEYTQHNPDNPRSRQQKTRRRVAVDIAPDGESVVSAAFSNRPVDAGVRPQLHIWSGDSETRITRRQLDLSDYPTQWGITCVAFSPDGKLIATGGSKLHGSDETLRIWNAETGEQLRAIKAHGRTVLDVTFSPDGDRVVSASEDKSIAVWDINSGRRLLRIGGLDFDLTVAYSPDGKRIISGDWSKRIRFWDTQTGVEVFSIDGLPTRVSKVAFSPDGKQIAASGLGPTGILKPTIWNSDAGCLPAVIRDKDESVSQRNAQKRAEAAAAIKRFASGLWNYRMIHGKYPAPGKELDAWFPEYVPKGASLLDPWGNRYGCQDIRREWPEGPKVWSNGADGKPNTDDDIEEKSSPLFHPKVDLDGKHITLAARCRVAARRRSTWTCKTIGLP